MIMIEGLEALYVQVRRYQVVPDGSPRFNPALLVTAVLYPVVAALFVIVFGVPERMHEATLVMRLQSPYMLSFAISALLAIHLFDRRRESLDSKFARMPTASSILAKTSLFVATLSLIAIQAVFVQRSPGISVIIFVLSQLAALLAVRRFLEPA